GEGAAEFGGAVAGGVADALAGVCLPATGGRSTPGRPPAGGRAGGSGGAGGGGGAADGGQRRGVGACRPVGAGLRGLVRAEQLVRGRAERSVGPAASRAAPTEHAEAGSADDPAQLLGEAPGRID